MPQRNLTGWEQQVWNSEYSDLDNLNCHKQTTKVLSMGKLNGGSLFIGNRIAQDMTVIDLTGEVVELGHKATHYAITFGEYGVPQWSTFYWESLAMTIYHELSQGNVTIVDRGHGRAGLFTSIIAYILMGKRYITIMDVSALSQDPTEWIRNLYCSESIQTAGQEICVLETCLSFKDNQTIDHKLHEIRAQLHYIYTPISYSDLETDWEYHDVEIYPYVCPVCLDEHDTLVQAIMCHNNQGLTICPVCGKKHELPVEAYQCHSQVPLP